MIWAAGWKLSSAVSKAGGLGLIGGGSMDAELFRRHIKKCRAAVDKPFGVNIPLMYKHAPDLMRVTMEEEVKIVFTSAGNPKKAAEFLKSAGVQWAHCVPTVKMALKVQDAGADAVVAEGTEAGGHNGFDGITTFCLIPQAADALEIPLIAAGGIADHRGFLAAMILGADGVQVGTRFAASIESSAHENYKKAVVEAEDTDVYLGFKSVGPVSMVKTAYAEKVKQSEWGGAGIEQLKELYGSGRGRLGIFLGDGEEGMFEAGQSAGLVKNIESAQDIVKDFVQGYWKKIKNSE